MTTLTRRLFGATLLATPLLFGATDARAAGANFVTAWTASAHGPYPAGNPTAQPELRFAFPAPEAGAKDQSFRLIVRPDIWGQQARIRLSNAFGTRPVTFDGVYLGVQLSGSAVLKGTNRAVTFAGKPSVIVAPGQSAISDPVTLPFAPESPVLAGRRLAVSFHVVGESGPMTWHAKALTTSYLAPPGSGSRGGEEGEAGFPFSTTSWYFLDAVDMAAPAGTRTVVTFGDSITDGTASTINGDDRWPDVFARRLHAAYGSRFAVVNQGIGGNQVLGPAEYTTAKPANGGPSALQRIERDIVSLSNVGAVIWLEGINDFGNAGASAEEVIAGVREGVKRLRAGIPGVRILMGTLTSSLNSSNGTYGSFPIEEKRRAFNQFVRGAGIFDGVVDFDAATFDARNGELRAEFVPNSTTGGPGDKLHPNRAGYLAMGNAVDLKMVVGK